MRRARSSLTAEIVAFMRATEQRKPAASRVLDDSLAEHFLGAGFRALLAPVKLTGIWPDRLLFGLTNFTVARHRFIDDALIAALDRDAPDRVEQVVVVGAGYDSRALRLADALGPAVVFEVDHPATARRKARLLDGWEAGGGPVRRVHADLMKETLSDALARSSFDASRRTFFIVEGLLMYLSRPALLDVLSQLRRLAAPGSRLALDCWYGHDDPGPAGTFHRIAATAFHPVLGEALTFNALPEAMEGLLALHGFRVETLADAEELRRRYLPHKAAIYPTTYVICARRAASP